MLAFDENDSSNKIYNVNTFTFWRGKRCHSRIPILGWGYNKGSNQPLGVFQREFN